MTVPCKCGAMPADWCRPDNCQHSEHAREIFDAEIAKRTSADEVAKLELLREYFCNPAFRRAMHDEVARINGIA